MDQGGAHEAPPPVGELLAAGEGQLIFPRGVACVIVGSNNGLLGLLKQTKQRRGHCWESLGEWKG